MKGKSYTLFRHTVLSILLTEISSGSLRKSQTVRLAKMLKKVDSGILLTDDKTVALDEHANIYTGHAGLKLITP